MNGVMIDIQSPENFSNGLAGKVVGVTGNPGSGKSTVSSFFGERGALVISGDELGYAMLRNDSPVFDDIVEAFGTRILTEKKEIDRKALAKIVFQSSETLNRLNRIVHPPMLQQIQSAIAAYKENKQACFFVLDAALIYEWKIESWMDVMIVVAASMDEREQRFLAAHRDHGDAFKKREAAQLPELYKTKNADIVIRNEGTLEQLRKRLQDLVEI
jgi:dephospho-CoA kinase